MITKGLRRVNHIDVVQNVRDVGRYGNVKLLDNFFRRDLRGASAQVRASFKF